MSAFNKAGLHFADLTAGMMPTVSSMAAAASVMMSVMVSVMMAAGRVGIKRKRSVQQRFYRLVRVTGYSTVKGDVRVAKSRAGSAANAAADECVNAQILQESCQSTVAVSVCVHNGGGSDLPICDLVDFKLFRVSEMLEHLSVFICYRNLHI